MTIVVATPAEDCPAVRALTAEGLKFEVGLCVEPNDYGKLLTKYWKLGETFILVEWDIVPWPDAIRQLFMCDHDCCRYAYPYDGMLKAHLGCVKFSSDLVKESKHLPEEWQWYNTPWDALWGYVPITHAHEHWPAVAHCKAIAA